MKSAECTEEDLANAITQIRHHPLLASLSGAGFSELVSHARLLRLKAEDSLFLQGEDAQHFFIVLAGGIKLFRYTSDGREIVLSVFAQDAAVGEAAMFMENHHYPANANATEHSLVISLSSKIYQQLLKHSSESCFGVLVEMASRLQNSMAEIEILTLKSASHRVIRFLISLMKEDRDKVEVKLPVAKQLIAARLAMQPETFSRIMNELKNKKLLRVKGCRITILSVSKMEALIDET